LFLLKTFKALNGLLCADVPLRNYSLTHSLTRNGVMPSITWVRGNSVNQGRMDSFTLQCIVGSTQPNFRGGMPLPLPCPIAP